MVDIILPVLVAGRYAEIDEAQFVGVADELVRWLGKQIRGRRTPP